jgi:hypothetical protein
MFLKWIAENIPEIFEKSIVKELISRKNGVIY